MRTLSGFFDVEICYFSVKTVNLLVCSSVTFPVLVSGWVFDGGFLVKWIFIKLCEYADLDLDIVNKVKFLWGSVNLVSFLIY